MPLITDTIEHDGARLAYDMAGDGPAVVLLHAGIADRRMWDDQFEGFARHFRVIRYDARAYGDFTDAGTPFYPHQDLRAVLDALGIARAALVGCSMGGQTAIDFALAYPARVAALVLVGPGLTGFDLELEDVADRLAEGRAAYQAGDKARAAEYYTRVWIDGPARQPEDVDAAVRARALDMMHGVMAIPDDVGEELAPDPPASKRLRELTMPVRVIVGEHDVADIHAVGGLIARALSIGITLLPDAAHLPNMEQPQAFNREALDFLRYHVSA